MITEFSIGDRVQLRKQHACGGNEWEITRTGADIRIKCVNCGRSVMLDRLDFMRAAKKRTYIAELAAAHKQNSGGAASDAMKCITAED